MERGRRGYSFSSFAKEYVRDNANGNCEFPGYDCPRPNNGLVHHITGVYVAKLDARDKSRIIDPDENANMLCDLHTKFLDVQEADQVRQLLYERKNS